MYDTLTEAQLRRRYHVRGLRVCKSRARNLHSNNKGGFQLVDGWSNTVVDGYDYDLTADDLRGRLPDWEARRDRSWSL